MLFDVSANASMHSRTAPSVNAAGSVCVQCALVSLARSTMKVAVISSLRFLSSTMEYRVSEPAMNTVKLPDGTSLPALGLGTWHMGESAATRPQEIAAVRLALELGYRVIDTAEMYGEGGAEEVVGEALSEAIRAGTVTRDE